MVLEVSPLFPVYSSGKGTVPTREHVVIVSLPTSKPGLGRVDCTEAALWITATLRTMALSGLFSPSGTPGYLGWFQLCALYSQMIGTLELESTEHPCNSLMEGG